MKKILLALACTAFMIGCASTPQEKSANALEDMQKEKTELINKGVAAGLGIGESVDAQTAMDKADLNARSDLAKSLETKIEGLSRSYVEEVGGEFSSHYENVKKNVTSTIVKGASLIKIKTEAIDNKIIVYGIMALDPKIIANALEAELKAQQADIARFRASKGYAENDKAVKEFEAYKAANSIK